MTSLAKEEVTFLLCPSLKGKRKRNRKLRQKNQKDQECCGCMGVYRYQSGIGIPFPISSSFVREIMKIHRIWGCHCSFKISKVQVGAAPCHQGDGASIRVHVHIDMHCSYTHMTHMTILTIYIDNH